MRLMLRRMSQRTVPNGVDDVVAGCPIAADGSLNGAWIEQHVIGQLMATSVGCQYGVAGFVIPSIDPETNLSYDTIWDEQVPKDTLEAAGALDYDC